MNPEKERMNSPEESEALAALRNLQTVLRRYTGVDPKSEDEEDGSDIETPINLNKTAEWAKIKEGYKYLVLKPDKLQVEYLREALKRMKDSASFLVSERKEALTEALIKAEIYLHGHDEGIEEREENKRKLRIREDLSPELVERKLKKEGIELTPRSLAHLKLRKGEIGWNEYIKLMTELPEEFD